MHIQHVSLLQQQKYKHLVSSTYLPTSAICRFFDKDVTLDQQVLSNLSYLLRLYLISNDHKQFDPYFVLVRANGIAYKVYQHRDIQ